MCVSSCEAGHCHCHLFVILFVFDKSGHIVTLACAYPAKYDLPAAADVRDAQERDRLQ